MCRFAVTLAILWLCLSQTASLPGQERFAVTLRSQNWIDAAAAKADPKRPLVRAAARTEENLSLPLLATIASEGTLAGHTDSGNWVIEGPEGAAEDVAKSGLAKEIGFDVPSDYRKVRQLVLTYDVADKPSKNELARAGIDMLKDNQWGKVGYMKVAVAAGEDGIPAALVKRIRQIDSIDRANANISVVIKAIRLPRGQAPHAATMSTEVPPTNDPEWSKLWGMKHIHAPNAWAAGRNVSPDVIVAVVDTGIDYRHADLERNMWRNDKGQVGHDYANNDADPMDDHGHGTHCAGTIAAVGNNKEGVVGVTWQTKLMALKFMNRVGDEAVGDLYDAALCIHYAIENNAQVINNSWENAFGLPMLKAALDAAQAKGIAVVAAAGNGLDGRGLNIDVTARYPASYKYNNLISVAALREDNTLAEFSNYGAENVDLAAPGVGIYSTLNPYDWLSGTSMAAPHVSGALALMLADPRFRDLQGSQLCRVLLDKVQELPQLSPSYGSTPRCASGGALNLAFLGNGTSPPSLTRQSFRSSQFSYEDKVRLAPRGGVKFSQITIETDQPVTLHIRANTSMRIASSSPGSYAHLITGFSPSYPPDGDLEHVELMPWKESLRPATVNARESWVNFGSVFSVELTTPGEHTIYWYALHSSGAGLEFGSGSMLVDILGIR